MITKNLQEVNSGDITSDQPKESPPRKANHWCERFKERKKGMSPKSPASEVEPSPTQATGEVIESTIKSTEGVP